MPYPQNPRQVILDEYGRPIQDPEATQQSAIPPTSPLGRTMHALNPFTWGKAALGGLQDVGRWAVTGEQAPNLVEPRTADWPAATSYPAMGEVESFLPAPKGSGAPSAYDSTLMAGGKGMAPWGDAPKLNTPGALRGLQAAMPDESYTPSGGMTGPKTTLDTGEPGGFGIPTTLQDAQGGYGNMEEVMRLANAEPGTTAPGASGYWQKELQDRLEPEDYNKLLERKQMETILSGLTEAHPAVSAALEAKARRAAMPQAAYGEAQYQGQVAGAQSRLGVEASQAAQKDRSSQIAYAGQLATALSRLMSSAQGVTPEGQRVAAQLQGLLLATLGDIEGVDMSEGIPEEEQ